MFRAQRGFCALCPACDHCDDSFVIRDVAKFEAFERELCRRERPDFDRNLALFDAMVRHAVELGALAPQDRLEGIEHDIELIRAINALRV